MSALLAILPALAEWLPPAPCRFIVPIAPFGEAALPAAACLHASPLLCKSSIATRAAPAGLPEYDEGERFDLRGGYVDNGWVDEDEVPLGEKLSSFFGFSKKKEVSKTAPRKGKK